MAIQQNFPSTRPSLNLNFARSKTLDPRITFTRTSSATYVDENGLVKIAPANSPRFDHDPVTGESLGLLIEEQRQNLLLQSVTPDNLISPWFKGPNTTRVGLTTAPDGTNTAIVYTGDGSSANIYVNQPVNLVSNTTYSVSIWAKLISGSVPTLGAIISAAYDNGSGITRSVVPYSSNLTSEWKRFSTTFTNVNAQTGISMFFITDQNNTAEIAIWGAQLEVGAFPTSYIPTLGSTATRTQDNPTITGTNFSSWFRQGEGTILTEARSSSGATYTGFIYRFQSNVGINLIDHYRQLDNQPVSSITFDGVNTYGGVGNGPIWTGTSKNRFALAYSSQNANQASNGNLAWVDDTSVTIPTLNLVRLGSNGGGPLNGTISQFTYYPSRLPNETIKTLTK